MILTKSIPAILCLFQACRLVAAQACPNYDDFGGFEDFEPYFFMNEMGTTPTCNIDPSQANFDYAVAVGGEFCLPMSDPVTIGLYYTGVDGHASSATATTVIAETYTSSLDLIFTGLPAKAISNGSPITVAIYEPSESVAYCGTATERTTLISDYVAIQTFVSTLVMTDVTSTFTSTVPTTSVSTATITQQAVAVAAPSTATITVSSGTNTVIGPVATTTYTRTMTQRKRTKTALVKSITTVTSSCVAPAVQSIKKRELPPSRWIGRMPAVQKFHKRGTVVITTFPMANTSDPISNTSMAINGTMPTNGTTAVLPYITGYCNSAISTTTLITSTHIASANTTVTDTNSVFVSTAFAYTTSTSTFSPTDTIYITSIGTTTYTPLVTRRSTTVLNRMTTTVTYTTAITKTKYPRHPPVCATAIEK